MNAADFESLPPAVRRKFFSNVERLRFRLAQSDPCSTPNHPVNAGLAPSLGLGPGPSAPRRLRPARSIYSDSPSTPSRARNYRSHFHLHSHSPRPRTHPRSRLSKQRNHRPALHLAFTQADADSQCFHALPAKIQQKLFSPEERRWLARTAQAQRRSVICDAADEAFYRGNSSIHSNRTGQSRTRSRRRSTDISSHRNRFTQPSTVFYDSDSDSNSNSDADQDWDTMSTMDESIYDSFRWLDEDGDLDLSLDEYHSHVAEAATKGRRMPSFRRSLSFSTHNTIKHRSSPSMPTRALPSSQTFHPLSPLPPISPLSPLTPRSTGPGSSAGPTSRPASRRLQSSHGAKSSISSIDPSAQYYHDPDARLKLRVYLASPQKFDEAIEFGFPSLHSQIRSPSPDQDRNKGQDQDQDQGQNKENLDPEHINDAESPANPSAGTFFEDDDGTVVGSPGSSVTAGASARASTITGPGTDTATVAGTATAASTYTSKSTPTTTATKATTTSPSIYTAPGVTTPTSPRLRAPPEKPNLLQRRASIIRKTKQPTRLPGTGGREMTLKMTLTRPDLREESPTPSALDDPLALAELPPPDRRVRIWEEERGLRRVWRRLRRR